MVTTINEAEKKHKTYIKGNAGKKKVTAQQ